MDQSKTTFPVLKANKNVKFQSKGSKNNMMYLGRFRRINKVGKCVEVIGTLRIHLFIYLLMYVFNGWLFLLKANP